jgi:8-oxo-dGTP pyrophosphatase MutT (NUDIX family)
VNYTQPKTREASTELPIQTGALPYRLSGARQVEILLVTGRRSRRWIIPKGWPVPGKTLAESAAQEAFEEAGIEGTIDPEPLGSFRHAKSGLAMGDIEVSIVVHAMYVERELSEYPECRDRKRKWFTAEEAADKVDSEELGKLIILSAERARLA